MNGDFNWARQVFRARDLIRKYESQKIFGGHALKLRRDFPSAAPTRNCQRARRVPAPANIEHGRVQQRLSEDVADRLRVEIAEDRLQRETMGWPQRKHD